MEKFISVSEMPQGGGYVPFIRIAGKYLSKFNFQKSDKVLISIKDNEINIKKMNKEETIKYLTAKNPNLNTLISSFDLE